MPQATFCRGDNVQTMNYTPGSDVNAGDVVAVDSILGIAVLDIPSGTLGALNIYGGSYIVNGDAAIAVGTPVFWVDADNEVSEAGVGKYFGVVVSACAGNGLPCEVAHMLASTVPANS